MPIIPGNPVVPVDTAGVALGTAGNPLVVSGAPAGDATIVDGGDVAEGAVADAAATAGAAGTLSAKLRCLTGQIGATNVAAVTDPTATATLLAVMKGILKILDDVWDDVGHTIRTST